MRGQLAVWALHPNLTAYDAAYVALAEEPGARLLTLDARLARSGDHLHVPALAAARRASSAAVPCDA